MRKLILSIIFLMACSFAAAAIIDNDFTTGIGGVAAHFATNLYFQADMDCSYSGTVLEGVPCSGAATVCPGGSLYIVPETGSTWARTYADIVASYPYCTGGGYCPSMIPYTSLNTNRYIFWLDNTKFNAYAVPGYADIPLYVGTAGIPLYDDLGTFYTQRMSYYNVSGGTIYTNKRGGANVFCNGDVEVVVNGAVRDTQVVGSPTIYTHLLTSEGVTTVTTRLDDVECFAAAVKHPLDRDRPDFFNFWLYGYDTPSVPRITSTPVTINVEDRQPFIRDTLVQITDSPTIADFYLIAITVRNYGDVAVEVTDVRSPSTADPFDASPLGCALLGIPAPPCPTDNGFDQSIPVGGTHTVYVLYHGTLSGTVITLVYEPLEPICSTETEFELDVSLESDIVRCEIEPPTLEAGQYEVHEYDVTCYNLFGEAVPCEGDDWFWADGLSGGFLARTSSYAWAYTSSSAGSTGTINYRTGSITCHADITSSETSPYFDCELDPSSATLEVGDSEYFDLTCYMDGVETPPTSAEYDNVDGLDGSITNSTIGGTSFTGTVASDGNLRAFARRTHHGDPTLIGAVAFAHINVGNATGEEVPDGGEEDEPCEIRPGTEDLYPHDGSMATLYCGEEGARTLCTLAPERVDWGLDSGLYGTVVDNTGTTATYVVGSTGTPAYGYYTSGLRATILDSSGAEEGSCRADINIVEPTCLEYT